MTDWSTAVHEGGHAVAAFLLKATRGAGPVTIEQTGPYGGVCFAGRAPRPSQADWARLAAPYPLVPSRLRRGIEIHVMVALAGQTAAELYAGRGAPEPELSAAAGPVAPVRLSAREQAVLEQTSTCDDPPRSDLGEATKALLAVHFDDLDLAHKHLAFLAHETEALMAGRRAGRLVHALANELIRSRTLSARRWKAALAAVS